MPRFTKCFEIMVAATLRKKPGISNAKKEQRDLQCQKRAMTYVSRKTKSRRQHALFLWPVKLMLWISNLFLHLVEITCFQKHTDGYLQTCSCQGRIYSHVKNNLLYTQFVDSAVKVTLIYMLKTFYVFLLGNLSVY